MYTDCELRIKAINGMENSSTGLQENITNVQDIFDIRTCLATDKLSAHGSYKKNRTLTFVNMKDMIIRSVVFLAIIGIYFLVCF